LEAGDGEEGEFFVEFVMTHFEGGYYYIIFIWCVCGFEMGKSEEREWNQVENMICKNWKMAERRELIINL